MNRKQYALIVMLLLAVGLLTACTATGASPTTETSGTTAEDGGSTAGMDHTHAGMDETEMLEELATLEGEAFEIAFIDGMIPHHRSAIEMAEIALERSEREEIRTAAQAIIDAQEAEIVEMTAWLDEWHGVTPSGEDHGMAMEAEVEALRSVPAEQFDVAFLEAMIPHHEGAISMAELVAERTDRPELNAVAQAILDAQRAENEQFAAWIDAWSGASGE